MSSNDFGAKDIIRKYPVTFLGHVLAISYALNVSSNFQEAGQAITN